MTKIYKSAPLPFQGQKRRYIGEFRRVLGEIRDARIFVDLFGGSGLLSHVAKRERPDAMVIYNDFDGYRTRLDNIARTNALISKLRNIMGGVNLTRSAYSRRGGSASWRRSPRRRRPGMSIILPLGLICYFPVAA